MSLIAIVRAEPKEIKVATVEENVVAKVVQEDVVVKIGVPELVEPLAKQAASARDEAIAAAAVAEDALAQIEDMASGAPDAPSILNKADKNGSNVEADAFRVAIGAARASSVGIVRQTQSKKSSISSSDPAPIDVIDGVVYGALGNDLYRSTNSGLSWALVATVTWSSGEIRRIMKCADGEVLLMRNKGLIKSVGWPSPTAWQAKINLDTGDNQQFIEWSLDGDGTKFIAADYAIPRTGSKYVWVSLDGGNTFTVVRDKAVHFPGPSEDTHFHGVAYDRWADRFWLCLGDAIYKGHYWSDDNGATWNLLPLHPSISGECQATTISATPGGMVLGSDSGANNGLYRILRTDDPADMRLEIAWHWPHINVSVRGFAYRNFYDEKTGITYTSFQTDRDYQPPIITWCDGVYGGVLYEYDGTFAPSDGFRNVVVMPNGELAAWLQRAGGSQQVRLPRPEFGASTWSSEDTGHLRGGVSFGGPSGVSVGPGARAAQFSVAIGPNASAIVTGSMAIGWDSVGGVNGTSIGMQAIAANTGVAIGRQAKTTGSSAVAVGYNASAAVTGIAIGKDVEAASASVVVGGTAGTRVQAVVVGVTSSSTVNGGVALGWGAAVSGAFGVAAGLQAVVEGEGGVAIGDKAKAMGNRATALGQEAEAVGVDSVALGNGAKSPGDANTVIGSGATAAAGNSSVVIGRNAKALGQWCVAVGQGSEANLNSVSVGLNAKALFTSSVALGTSTVADRSDVVSIGQRDLDVQGNGTKGLVLRSPDGSKWRLTIDDTGVEAWTKF